VFYTTPTEGCSWSTS